MQEVKEELYKCARCQECRESVKIASANKPIYRVCPVREVLGFDSYTGRGRLLAIRHVYEDLLKLTKENVHYFYTCTLCGNCREVCIARMGKGVDVPAVVEAFRRDLYENQLFVDGVAELVQSVKENRNPYFEKHEERLSWLKGIEAPIGESAEYIYFVGCTSSYRTQKIARATVELFNKIGLNYTLLKDEWCCGSTLLRVGAFKEVDELVEHNLQAFKDAGAKYIVTSCAGCYRTFKLDYPKIAGELGVEILHITELLAKLLKEGKISFKEIGSLKLTYHDPCHLGRHAGVYDAPREVIRAIPGVELIEMQRAKSYSFCCGYGGGVRKNDPELALKLAKNRVQEALQLGVDTLVTACPFCVRGLSDGASELQAQVKVLDLVELAAQAVVPAEKVEVAAEGLAEVFMKYLQAHPEIFDELKEGSTLNYFTPDGNFHVVKTGKHEIRVEKGAVEKPDVDLHFTEEAVKRLTSAATREVYMRIFGEETKKKNISFKTRASLFTLARRGYVSWARKAGVI